MAKKSMKSVKQPVVKAKPPEKPNMSRLIGLVNKKSAGNAAFNLREENPSDIKYWISTGSLWLDAIIAKGIGCAGYPGGRITELAGLSSTGKSYLLAQAIADAQKKGMLAVLFDSENAVDSGFLELAGVNIGELLYIQAQNCEFVLDTIETLLGDYKGRILFGWDSLANTPAKADQEGDFNPNSSIAVKARVISRGLSKLTLPIANHEATFIVCNQLKENISGDRYNDPLITPGGKSFDYMASLRLFLIRKFGDKHNIHDARGYNIGSDLKVRLKKSRFGTERRECSFKLLWGGDDVRVQDEESWVEAIKPSEYFDGNHGSWRWLYMKNGSRDEKDVVKWQGMDEFLALLKDNKAFKKRILYIIQNELVEKFAKKLIHASNFIDNITAEEEAAKKKKINGDK